MIVDNYVKNFISKIIKDIDISYTFIPLFKNNGAQTEIGRIESDQKAVL